MTLRQMNWKKWSQVFVEWVCETDKRKIRSSAPYQKNRSEHSFPKKKNYQQSMNTVTFEPSRLSYFWCTCRQFPSIYFFLFFPLLVWGSFFLYPPFTSLHMNKMLIFSRSSVSFCISSSSCKTHSFATVFLFLFSGKKWARERERNIAFRCVCEAHFFRVSLKIVVFVPCHTVPHRWCVVITSKHDTKR